VAKILCYTSPARGHLYPTVPVLDELQRRGHEVVVLTLADELPALAARGLTARPIAAAIEAIAHDDYQATTPPQSLARAVSVFVARARHEIDDLRAALREHQPDGLLVDFNSWGAAAFAEADGRPWALFMPYFLPWRLPGLPPFGPGLASASGLWGRARDALVGKVLDGFLDRHLPLLNAVRSELGLAPLAHLADFGRAAPRVLHYTAEPFEYPCPARPANVVSVGPLPWEPAAPAPPWLEAIDRPLVLVTCSTEYQADGKLVSAALEGLASEAVTIVATTAAIDPAGFRPPPNAHIARFVPHGPVLARAACVVCHGGMGITQKALAAGVPVCVVPFGRDQLEVARHVEWAKAGVRLLPRALTPARLRAAVYATRERSAGAARVAAAFREAGGAPRAAAALEGLLS
jgi:MGT family glycosyltransferase